MTTNKKVKAVTASIPAVSGTVIGSLATVVSGAVVGAITSVPKGFQLSVQQMLQGLQTVLPAGSALASASGPVTQATLVSQMQAVLQAYQTVSDDEVQLKESRASFSAQLPTFHQQYSVMKNLLVGFFGAGSPQLAKFGLKPRAKARTLTPEQRVARQTRSNETRSMRGTLGSREKQAVVFNGTVQVSATPVSSAAQAASAAPAESAQAEPVATSPTLPGAPPGK